MFWRIFIFDVLQKVQWFFNKKNNQAQIFSVNTIEFNTINTTITSHLGGEIISHEGQLVAIGGVITATVEVLQNKIWNNNVIPVVGSSYPLSDFSSLSTKNGLYVFGELTIFK